MRDSMVLPEYTAEIIPNKWPERVFFPYCTAPGCGDKIKDETVIMLTSKDGQKVLYLEDNGMCECWFQDGHPDYGCPKGRITF